MENFASNNFYEPWKINPQTRSQHPKSAVENIEKTKEKATISQAQNYIIGILNETMMMGANDYELSALMNLFEKVGLGAIDPEQAMKDALMIKESKNTYH
jgi:hypothetical protein